MKQVVSVIIPVYNTEKYLDNAIKPFISQNSVPVELILIDDGSTDKSSRICDYYNLHYNNIIVRHIHNAGVSNARNLGLTLASGDFIYFIDSDDIVVFDEFITMYTCLTTTSSPMVISGFSYCNDIAKNNKIEDNGRAKVLTGTEASEALLKWEVKCCIGSFMLRREIATRFAFNISTKYGEDMEYIHMCMLQCNRITILSGYSVKYRIHTSSAIQKYNLSRFDCYESRKRLLNVVVNVFSEARRLENTLRYFSLPEAMIETLKLLSINGVSYKVLWSYLNLKGFDNDIKTMASDINTNHKFKKTLFLWCYFSRIIYIYYRILHYTYICRVYIGKKRRRFFE